MDKARTLARGVEGEYIRPPVTAGGNKTKNKNSKRKKSKRKKSKRGTFKKSKRRTVKKNKSNYKITIHKKNFSDSLYKYFKRIRINPKHNFISFTTENKDDKIIFSFRSRINQDYNSDPSWKDITCKEYILSDTMIIKTECDIGSFHKIFVQDYDNLYEYIQSVKKNKTDKKDHQLLFDKILKNLTMLKDKNLINHNLDVKTLHFKYI